MKVLKLTKEEPKGDVVAAYPQDHKEDYPENSGAMGLGARFQTILYDDRQTDEKRDVSVAIPTLDPSPSIPPYSSKSIHTLLEAYGISSGIQAKLSKDESRECDIYFYPIQTLTVEMLLQDTIRYLLERTDAAGNRRVCFLLSAGRTANDQNDQPVGLIIQLSQFQKSLAEKLLKQLMEQQLSSVDAVLKANQSGNFNEVKYLYGEVHCLFLGSTATPALMQGLIPSFKLAYTGAVSIDFKAAASVNPSIQLTDDIIQMLKNGKTREIASQDVFKEHRQQAVQILLQSLELLAKQDSVSHAAIQEKLTILFKYLSLEQYRLSRYDIKGNTIEDLEQLLACDKQVKATIYGNSVDHFAAHLSRLDMAPITQMLTLKNTPDQLLQQLGHSQRQQQKRIADWERDIQAQIQQLNRAWFPYLWQRGKKATRFLYQNSLVSLGAELIHWMGQSIGDAVPDFVKAEVKQWIQNSAKWTVLCCTLSPRLAKQSYEATGRWLTRDTLSVALKVGGGAVGWMLTYANGIYSTARMLGMGTVTLYLYDALKLPRILDDKAIVLAPYRYQPSPTTLLRMLNISFAILETTHFKNVQPLIHAMGGLGGSVVVTTLAQRLFQELQTQSGQPATQDQMYILFLLSLAGYDFGRMFAEYSHHNLWVPLLNQCQAREQLIMRLRESAALQKIEDCTIESPTMFDAPLLWLKSMSCTDPVKMTWRGKNNHFYDAECAIPTAPTLVPNKLQPVVCNVTMLPPRITEF